MNTNTKTNLLKLLKARGPMGPSAIAAALQISPQMAHRHLKSLLLSGEVRRQGVSPKVLYFAQEKRSKYQFPQLTHVEEDYINQHYLTVKPDDEVIAGLEGFQWWALKMMPWDQVPH